MLVLASSPVSPHDVPQIRCRMQYDTKCTTRRTICFFGRRAQLCGIMPFALSSWPPSLDGTHVCTAVCQLYYLLYQAHGVAATVVSHRRT